MIIWFDFQHGNDPSLPLESLCDVHRYVVRNMGKYFACSKMLFNMRSLLTFVKQIGFPKNKPCPATKTKVKK